MGAGRARGGEGDKGGAPAGGLEFLGGGEEDAQAGGADVGEGGQVEHECLGAGGEDGVDALLKGGAGEAVKAAGEGENSGVGVLGFGDFHDDGSRGEQSNGDKAAMEARRESWNFSSGSASRRRSASQRRAWRGSSAMR
jgi:hypothetical protein